MSTLRRSALLIAISVATVLGLTAASPGKAALPC